jgi:hypothetical protein
MLLLRYPSMRLAWGAVATFAASALLAGCGGAQSQLSPQGVSQVNSTARMPGAAEDKNGCPPHKGAVRVTPCTVDLSSSNPGPVTLTLKTPHGSKGTIREHDVCGTNGIATISGSGDTWSVTAGPNAGTCLANFAYFNNGHKVQYGRSRITNTI